MPELLRDLSHRGLYERALLHRRHALLYHQYLVVLDVFEDICHLLLGAHPLQHVPAYELQLDSILL